mmetsp:Transcript_14848/g.60681  ORF Transcript_14848/g.60681 Transcript_14848/m.60681 type:complete len:393 (+) Transcript_14848:50-1228(+)
MRVVINAHPPAHTCNSYTASETRNNQSVLQSHQAPPSFPTRRLQPGPQVPGRPGSDAQRYTPRVRYHHRARRQHPRLPVHLRRHRRARSHFHPSSLRQPSAVRETSPRRDQVGDAAGAHHLEHPVPDARRRERVVGELPVDARLVRAPKIHPVRAAVDVEHLHAVQVPPHVDSPTIHQKLHRRFAVRAEEASAPGDEFRGAVVGVPRLVLPRGGARLRVPFPPSRESVRDVRVETDAEEATKLFFLDSPPRLVSLPVVVVVVVEAHAVLARLCFVRGDRRGPHVQLREVRARYVPDDSVERRARVQSSPTADSAELVAGAEGQRRDRGAEFRSEARAFAREGDEGGGGGDGTVAAAGQEPDPPRGSASPPVPVIFIAGVVAVGPDQQLLQPA